MRRRFLLALTFLLLVGVVTPAAAHAGTPNPPYNFVLQAGFEGSSTPAPPPGGYWPDDVAADQNGRVYAVDTDQNRVQVYDSAGVYRGSFGTTGTDPGELNMPRSVAVDRFGNVYVAEYYGLRVQVFDPLGNYLRQFDGAGSGAAFGAPDGVAVGRDGNVYVNDWLYSVRRIVRLGWYGDYRGSWDTSVNVSGVAVDPWGNVFGSAITSGGTYPEGDGFIKYSPTGAFLGWWGGVNGGALGQFDYPFDVSCDPAGRLMVAEFHNHRVQVFDRDNRLVSNFGGNGQALGQFENPSGISAGFDRDVWVADSANWRIQKFEGLASTEQTEVAGDTRILTAVAISKKAFPNGADTVLIATGYNFPDALGGAALAHVFNAPILLTSPTQLLPEVSAEIDRLGASGAVILGGTGAVNADVETALRKKPGLSVSRVGGADRFETACLIASATVAVPGNWNGQAFVAYARNFPDALAASPIAAANGWPIYLTDTASLRTSVKTAMVAAGVQKVTILGSDKVVSSAVEQDLKNTFGVPNVERVWGADRYETATEIAEWGVQHAGMYWSNLAVVTGENYPDALAGGPLQGRDCSVMLLTKKLTLPDIARSEVEAIKKSIYEVRFLGSTAAVSQPVRDAVMAPLY